MTKPWRWLPQAVLILAIGGWIYAPAISGGWIWDDDTYIAKNAIIHDSAGWWEVWTHPDGQGDYYPLTSFVEWCEWHLWGDDTLPYHLFNVGLHCLSAFLIWRLFARIGLRFAWFGAFLFVMHPIMVESVAWIAELKNTLSLPPLLLAMLAWLGWREGRGRNFYLGALAFFVVSLLAKTSGLMLPVVFLLHTLWKDGRISRQTFRATIPFFALSLAAGIVTLTPHHDPGAPLLLQPDWNWAGALAAVGWTPLFLLGKCLLPVALAPVYPGYADLTPSVIDLAPWILIGALAALLWAARAVWGRHLLFGLGFFLVNLFPVLLYVFKRYTIMVWSMDHLVYLPVIGLIGLAVAGIAYAEARLAGPWPMVAGIVLAAAMGGMLYDSATYAGWYRNAEVFWTRILQRDPDEWLAHENISGVLMDQHRYAEALAHDQRFLELKPKMSDAHYNLGLALRDTGRSAEAVDQFEQASRINPTDGKVYLTNGTLLVTMGKITEAIAQYQQAIQTIPDYAPLRYNLGSLLLDSGNVPGAIEQLEAAVALDPGLAKAQENLGSALAQSGRVPEAIPHFDAAVEIDPTYVIARNNLALALAQTGHVAAAIEQFQQVLVTDPDNAKARESLAKLQAFKG
jgi:tetratricopeptide (TPR) repeat protein